MQLGTPFGKVFGLKSFLRFSTAIRLSEYIVGGFTPQLVFDFENEKYFTDRLATTFDSAITHSRSGNATMVDSDGLLKWAPHNLLTYSEGSGTASSAPGWTWLGGGSGESAATLDNGIGGYSVSGGDRFLSKAVSLNATQYTLAMWINPATTYAGNILQVSGFASASGKLTAKASDADANGYVSVTFQIDAGDTGGDIRIGQVNSGSGTLVFGGWHLYRSDLGGMVDVPQDARAFAGANTYVPTTSSAVYLPRRRHHVYDGTSWVNEGLLVESEARTNLLTYSLPDAPEPTNWLDFATGNVGKSLVALQNGIPGIEFVAVANRPRISQTVTLPAAGTYTASVYVENTFGDLDTPNKVLEIRDIDGVTTLTSAYWADRQDDGRVHLTITATAPGRVTFQYGPGIDGNTSTRFVAGGPQLEQGSTPSSYIPTSGSTVTRSADTLTVPSANLPWPTPTALSARNDLINNSGWIITDGGAA